MFRNVQKAVVNPDSCLPPFYEVITPSKETHLAFDVEMKWFGKDTTHIPANTWECVMRNNGFRHITQEFIGRVRLRIMAKIRSALVNVLGDGVIASDMSMLDASVVSEDFKTITVHIHCMDICIRN